jgi:predicted amidophosphoribosyltransferase
VIKKDDIKNRKVLIVDDVFTTGSTLEECAKAVKEKGALEVYALCIATGS